MTPRRLVSAVMAAILMVAACSNPTPTTPASASPDGSAAGPTVYPVIISRELIPGPNRFVFSFLDATGTTSVGAPNRTASVAFTGPGGEKVASATSTFIWAIEGQNGVYVAHVDFPLAGVWNATFTTAAPGAPGAPEESIQFSFDVLTDAHVLEPGEQAPSVDTPTLADVGGDVAKISTDEKPEKRFYETSVAEALAANKPFVLVFATPKFCVTKTCGPTLEKVKEVAATHPDVTFINVEPYKLKDVDGQLQPDLSSGNQLQTVPATDAYGLLTEPFVFVVGGDGLIKASFELIFTPEEISAALDGLS